MRLLKKIPVIILIAVNLAVIAAMNFCAYSSCVPPQEQPGLSYFGLMFPVFLAGDVLFLLFWLIVKWRLALLPIVGMCLCAGSVRSYIPFNLPSAHPEGSIKFLSYNVMGFGERPKHPWQENHILHYLLESKADIICLQEAQKRFIDNAIDSISELYPYHHTELKNDNYIVCFSKFPIISTQSIDYPTKTNCSNAYEMLVGKDTLLVINNHLESYKLSKEDKADYKSIIQNYKHPESNHSETKYHSLTEKISQHDSIRGIQADSVAAYIARAPHRYIIACGDFNASPVSYPHNRLTERLNDAYTRSGNGPGTSYNRSGMYFRIDHILVSPDIEAYEAKVDKSINKSDHYPIHCYVKLK